MKAARRGTRLETKIMKTAEEILALTSTTIAHIHNRTGMYVGSPTNPGAANTLDGVFWLAHWSWTSIQGGETDYRDVYSAICQRHKFGSLRLPGGFRRLNPEADEETAFRFVLACWREIGEELGIDISPEL